MSEKQIKDVYRRLFNIELALDSANEYGKDIENLYKEIDKTNKRIFDLNQRRDEASSSEASEELSVNDHEMNTQPPSTIISEQSKLEHQLAIAYALFALAVAVIIAIIGTR